MSSLSEPSSSDKKESVKITAEISNPHLTLSLPFILLIHAYRFISPVKQLIFGPYARCRFHPTCSEYALECFRTLPLYRAIPRSLSRIFRCNPMHPGGHDPVHPNRNDFPHPSE